MHDVTRAFRTFSRRDDDDGERERGHGIHIQKPITLLKMEFRTEAEFRAFAQCWRVE